MGIRIISNPPDFIAACQRAGIQPTYRQWCKWRQRRGKAWAHREGT